MSQHIVTTQDIYESAYFLSRGARLLTVQAVRENNRVICKFSFAGEALSEAQAEYYNATAQVNLWEFRRYFTQVNALIGTARSEYREKRETSTQKEV